MLKTRYANKNHQQNRKVHLQNGLDRYKIDVKPTFKNIKWKIFS